MGSPIFITHVTKKQGSLSLYTKYLRQYVVCVFRSSNLKSVIAPTPIMVMKKNGSLKEKTSYRYDGLDKVSKVIDHTSGQWIIKHLVAKDINALTFLLHRVNTDSNEEEDNVLQHGDILH